jgi:CRISPR-associated protein Cmr3
MSKFQVSSQKNPCPVCGRTKDGDCRDTGEGLVLCHSEINSRQAKEEFNGFIYLGEDSTGNWGKWLLKSGEFKKERTPGQEFRYPFYDCDGNVLVEEVRVYQATGGKKTWMEPKGIDTSKLAPYRYSEALQALKDGATECFICEGPPKADALWELGIPSVSFANGFKASRDSHWFEGFEDRLIVAADRDKPGLEKAGKVLKAYPLAKLLKPCPESAYWEPEFIAHGGGFDIKDWIEQLKREGLDAQAIKGKLWAAVEDQPTPQAPGGEDEDTRPIIQLGR